MVANIKYYVLTIVSIFLALGIGIFIGFMFDAQNILMSQKEDIVSQLEERFENLQSENQELNNEVKKITEENEKYIEFTRTIYPELIRDKLIGLKVAIIETNDDYIYSSIGADLEMAGSEVTSITTIKDSFLTDQKALAEIYAYLTGEDIEEIDIANIELIIDKLINAIINGTDEEFIHLLNEKGIVDNLGDYRPTEPIDYIVLAGGSQTDDSNKIKTIDKTIINYTKGVNIPIVGIEKEKVEFSYINEYKDARISSVDNVDTVIGKVALVYTMKGMPGNYGIKDNAEFLMPGSDGDINPE